ncbi:MAG: carboxypeptidase-like regulatory domain-containing protein [Acidobacteriota bacterium]
MMLPHPRPARLSQLNRLVLFLAIFIAAFPVAAQSGTASAGTIIGTAVGAHGEEYGGAKVVLSANGLAAPLVQTTGDNGQFQFADVPAGSFSITLSAPGFTSRTVTGVLQAGQVAELGAVELTLADTTTSVVVSGASEHEIAQQQINVELKQRILGVIPNFYVVYDHHFAPMSARQKLDLALRSNIDPITFAGAAIFAGMEQGENFPAYGAGWPGYAQRFGQSYADGFIANLIGNGLLAAAFKQDPRYFYKGTGSAGSRAWYALYTSFMCKGDNGQWQFDYSAIMGGLAAGGISELYYPPQNRNGATVAFEGAGLGIGFAMVQNLAQEFLIKKLTTHAGKQKVQQP